MSFFEFSGRVSFLMNGETSIIYPMVEGEACGRTSIASRD